MIHRDDEVIPQLSRFTAFWAHVRFAMHTALDTARQVSAWFELDARRTLITQQTFLLQGQGLHLLQKFPKVACGKQYALRYKWNLNISMQKRNRDLFHERFYHRNSKLTETWFQRHSIV